MNIECDMPNLTQEKKRLSQESKLQYFEQDFKPLDMLPVYHSIRGGLIYSSLVPLRKKAELFSTFSSDHSWPGQIGELGFYSVYSGVEPLTLPRRFYGVKPDYREISEEFRLFHNLYYDRIADCYFKIDEAGNETKVATATAEKLEIRLKEIREFLAHKEMYLCLQFEFTEGSDNSLEELGMSEQVQNGGKEMLRWRWLLGDGSFGKTSSFLRGIRLIAPFPQKPPMAFSEEPEYADFIVGIDDEGKEINHTCNPDSIDKSDGSAAYLTPVVFNRSVLDKYIDQPSKYSVDGHGVKCGGLWYLRIDNDRDDDKVIVWLGDLSDLPTYEEQLHWRAHNIASDARLSETAFKTQILAEWSDPGRTEHVFQKVYLTLIQSSMDNLGWQLLRPLHEDDEYRLSDVRVPAYDEQKALDDFVGNLHKVLIESLNSRGLAKLVPAEERECLAGKSITLLKRALESRGIEVASHIVFLRNLNDLRNKIDGHRKGGDYARVRAKFAAEEEDIRVVCQRILDKSVSFLEFLCEVVPTLCEHHRSGGDA